LIMAEDIPLSKVSLAEAKHLAAFKPTDIGLPEDFILTKFAQLKG